jgi:hypothetical protein
MNYHILLKINGAVVDKTVGFGIDAVDECN